MKAFKLVKKLIALILSVLLFALVGFWVYCNLAEHRSLMSGVTDLVLRIQHRSDKFTYLDACEAFAQGLIKGVSKEHFEPVSGSREKPFSST